MSALPYPLPPPRILFDQKVLFIFVFTQTLTFKFATAFTLLNFTREKKHKKRAIFGVTLKYPLNSLCVKHVRIRSYSGPHFPAFGLNTDQNNSEYGHFLRSECCKKRWGTWAKSSKDINHHNTSYFCLLFVSSNALFEFISSSPPTPLT